MTRKKATNNRKRDNKITVYLPDEQRDYVSQEKSAGISPSETVQRALSAYMADAK